MATWQSSTSSPLGGGGSAWSSPPGWDPSRCSGRRSARSLERFTSPEPADELLGDAPPPALVGAVRIRRQASVRDGHQRLAVAVRFERDRDHAVDASRCPPAEAERMRAVKLQVLALD